MITTREVGTGNQQVYQSDIMILAIGATPNLILPSLASMREYKDKTGGNLQPIMFFFKFEGTAITITPHADDKVDYLVSETITGYATGTITATSNNDWIVRYSQPIIN